VALVLARSIAGALYGLPMAQAAQPPICTTCPPPSPAPYITVTSDGRGTLTVTGYGFTTGGRVQIVASMPPGSMGAGGRTTVTVTASIHPAGAIDTTFPLTFGCGAGVDPVTVRANDESTARRSNAVSISPWGALPC
jgi:hypothetical protein